MVALLARLGRYDELESLRSQGRWLSRPKSSEWPEPWCSVRGPPKKPRNWPGGWSPATPLGLDARGSGRLWVLGELGKTDEAERSIRQLVDRNVRDLAGALGPASDVPGQSQGNFAKALAATIEQMKARVKAGSARTALGPLLPGGQPPEPG